MRLDDCRHLECDRDSLELVCLKMLPLRETRSLTRIGLRDEQNEPF
jgi:hypothetical protein